MIQRHLMSLLQETLAEMPVVFLAGARQAGKSTLAQEIVRHRGGRYLTLDEADVLSAANGDPRGFLSGLGDFTVIDEVQRAPALLPAIKVVVDRDRMPGRFLLTGSANVLTLPNVSEPLAGRMLVARLHTLSQGELDGRREGFVDAVFAGDAAALVSAATTAAASSNDIEARVLRGGYPETVAKSRSPRPKRWFGSYITILLQRDVRDIADIAGLSEVPRLLSLLAARATSPFNRSDLARDLGWPRTTVDRYLSLLKMVFLYELLPAWSTNLSKRLVRAPKVVFSDTGLASHLLGFSPDQPLRPEIMGRLLENFVAMEIEKQSTWSRTDARLYHFRTHAGLEVDLLLEDRRGRIVGVEVKATTTPEAAMFRSLKRFADDLGDRFRMGVLLSRGERALAFGEKLVALPVDSLWRITSPDQEE